MDQYFVAVLRWILSIKSIVERNGEHNFRHATREDRLQLWFALMSELPDAIKALECFYIPALEEALKSAKLK